MKNVGILLFNEVEVLDFAGPFEVFSVTGRRDDSNPFNVFTVAESPGTISARNNLVVTPTYSFENCPDLDILVVPGGYGTRREMLNKRLVKWVTERADDAEIVLSVCTGALILAKGGLLDGLPATTHHLAIEDLRKAAPKAIIQADQRVIDNDTIVVAAGVSSGIDASFHVVRRICGEAAARECAAYMEYPWEP